MRLASYRHEGHDAAGLVIDGQVYRIPDMTRLGVETLDRALAAEPTGSPVPLADVELRPVIPDPRRIVCVGLNYRAHVSETERELPNYPVLFTKFASSLVAAGQTITVPPESDQVDFEAELAVVIGRAGRRIEPQHAGAHIAGYTVANDITMRDFQYKTHQWLQGKSWDDSTPLGPFLVTADEFDDHPTFDISLQLNGDVMQQSDTSRLIFDVPSLISSVSTFTRLEPGDVILTGTPGGVGFRRTPQVFLKPGDRVSVTISGLGTLDNTVSSDAAARQVTSR